MSFQLKDKNGKWLTIGELSDVITSDNIVTWWDGDGFKFTLTDIASFGSDYFGAKYVTQEGRYTTLAPTVMDLDSVDILGFSPTRLYSLKTIGGNYKYNLNYQVPSSTPELLTGYYYPLTDDRGVTSSWAKLNDGLPFFHIVTLEGERPPHISNLLFLYPQLVNQDGVITGYVYRATTRWVSERALSYINGDSVEWREGEPDTPSVDDNKGDFDNTSDTIDIPDISELNAVNVLNNGSVRAFEFNNGIPLLNQELFSKSFIDTIIKVQNSPIENIQKLYLLPVPVSALNVGNNIQVNIGNYTTNITAPPILQEFYDYDMGELDIKEYYGNSLDYDTDIDIFLPFIGTRRLNTSDVMASRVRLIYRFDVVTGNCIALIKVSRTRDDTSLNAYLYAFEGNLSVEFPLSQQINRTLSNVFALASPMNFISKASGLATAFSTGMEGVKAIIGGNAVDTQHTGNLSVVNGYMSVMRPYIRVSRPVNIKPSEYANYYGYPSYYTRYLSDVSGFTVVNRLVNNLPNTIPENIRKSIENELFNGVYL